MFGAQHLLSCRHVPAAVRMYGGASAPALGAPAMGRSRQNLQSVAKPVRIAMRNDAVLARPDRRLPEVAKAVKWAGSLGGTRKDSTTSFTKSESLVGPLPVMDHARGGLSGWAPVHLFVDSRIVHGFRWLPVRSLLPHEDFIHERQADLLRYIESLKEQYTTMPAIIACSRSSVILDGHHRTSVIMELGYEFAPVLFIDYTHPDVMVHPPSQNGDVTKQDVILAGMKGTMLPPKSTAHVISDGSGRLQPLISLSPICDLVQGQTPAGRQ